MTRVLDVWKDNQRGGRLEGTPSEIRKGWFCEPGSDKTLEEGLSDSPEMLDHRDQLSQLGIRLKCSMASGE